MPPRELHQDDRGEFRAAMKAALGPDVRLYAIIARGAFALRYGPLTLEEVDDLVEWGQDEHVPVMITADCGALPDRDLAASLFGDTREARAEAKDQARLAAKQHVTALCQLGENVNHLLSEGGGRDNQVRIVELNRTFAPIRDMQLQLRGRIARAPKGAPTHELDCLAAHSGVLSDCTCIPINPRDDNCELPKPPPEEQR